MPATATEAAIWLLEGPALTVEWDNEAAAELHPDAFDIPISEVLVEHPYAGLVAMAEESYRTGQIFKSEAWTRHGKVVLVTQARVEDGQIIGAALYAKAAAS